ncbi:receptor-like protein kinase 5 [Juglans microcarpa x Juglans regia]|uniref:receptor-like protein kinase 5 n=1 Tax=Juglans microcarpa x Juglans regia TaxID=2249226 RepID=UPI001B7F4EC1|nr:receptor-like protein kinase 5 [Juglans microcarpa x Juglans regia]
MSRTIPTSVDFSLYANNFMIILLLLLLLCHANSQLSTQEQAVLLNLKQHWQNPNSLSVWIPWNSSSHCSWLGITCFDGSVTELHLQSKNIYGTVPPFICNLKNLKAINLSDNYFSSTKFPRALYNCSKLEDLDLSQNYFAGAIPDDIHHMAWLHNLNLGGNSFFGNIPSSVGQLTELRTLKLFACSFIGSLPPEIGNLSNLEELGLAFNSKMTPRLPSEFTKLKKLKLLWMAQMNLVGEIPDKFGEMASLEHLDLSSNYLTGKIPSSLLMPKNLRIVYLYINNLSGEIPRVVEALNLEIIDLSENNFTGTIPDDFGKLRKLSGLSLFCNQLFGKIPNSIGRLPGLIVLKVFSNNFSGTLPPDLGRYSMLQEFQVATNMLTGQLPEHLCDNGRLLGVVAFENNLDGELPKSLGNCSSLIIVRVSSNQLSGCIPSGLWTSQNMRMLMLSDNSFTGELPEILSRNLSRLEICNNMFSGKIPEGASSWRNLVVLEASNNLLNGTIPQGLTILPHLTTLLLDQNQLSGSLPSDIISWKALNTLNVSRNAISGQIPGKLGFLPSLSELDLSENQLSSQIPPQLGFLRLTSLNLSSNHLSGSIPIEFENDAYANSFLNNPGLCANRPSLNINECNSKLQNPSKNSHQLMAWIISLAIAVVLGLLISLFIIGVYGKRKHGLDSTWNITPFQNLNFTKSDILSGLTEKNVIGCGGSGKVYCVSLNNSLDLVAVKKIWNNRKLEEKLEKEFLAEVKILSSIRHSNIVKLLCCISSDNLKLLVYDYLENGSLDQWLHKKSRASTVSGSIHHVDLDWPKRLHIAVGAAQGLAYMHHDCSPPIVHRDVKSSNILLDLEFNAQIADFGLAQMLIKEGESATMSSVAGSFGYIAPEYAHTTRVNEKIDVYSFGVILLELTIGRKANDGDEHTSLAEWAWRYVQEEKFIADALDDKVKEHCYMDSMCCVFRLGLSCTRTHPFTRPSMKEVLKVLLRCYNQLLLGYGEKINGASHACDIDVFPLKSSKRDRMLEHDDEDDGVSLASIV